MARSSYIYIVTEPSYEDTHILAAFTVKHECITWLAKNPSNAEREIHREPDGGDQFGRTAEIISEKDFIA